MFKLNNLTDFFATPASRKQAGYKNKAKSRGLLDALLSKVDEKGYLNADELNNLVLEAKELNTPEILQDVFANQKTKLCLDIPVQVDLAKDVNDKGLVTLSNVVIYENNKNFHNLNLETKELEKTVKDFNSLEKESENRVLNVDHSRYPQDSIGEFSNLSFKDGKVLADVTIDTVHPSFASQKYVLEQGGVELGFSVELAFGDVLLSLTKWEFKFVDPQLVGLATTLIPSAPGTLTNLEVKEVKNLETKETKELTETVDLSLQLENFKKDYDLKIEKLEKDNEFLTDKLISTLSTYKELLEKQNQQIIRLKKLQEPKEIKTF